MAGRYNPAEQMAKVDTCVRSKRDKLTGIMSRSDFKMYTTHPLELNRSVSMVANYRWTAFELRLIELPDYLPLVNEEFSKIRPKDMVYAKLLDQGSARFVFQGKVPISMSTTLKVDIHETDISRILKRNTSLESTRSNARMITTELYILRYMRHENLVQSLYAYSEEKLSRITFLTPRAVPLRALIKTFKIYNREQVESDHSRGIPSTSNLERVVPPELVRYIVTSVLQGLRFLHEAGFIHRNLDTNAVVAEHDGTVKIGNFNNCRYLREDGSGNSIIDVNPEFCAPSLAVLQQNVQSANDSEYYQFPALTEQADFFSLGLIVLSLIYDKTSFVNQDGVTLPQLMERDNIDTYFTALKKVNEVVYLDIKADLNMDAGAFTFLNTVLRRVAKTNAAGLLQLEFAQIDGHDYNGFKKRFTDSLTTLDILPKKTYGQSTTLDRVRRISKKSRFHEAIAPHVNVSTCVNPDKKESLTAFPYKFNDGAVISLNLIVKVKCPEKVVNANLEFEYGNEPSLVKALSELVDNEEDLKCYDEGFMVFMPWDTLILRGIVRHVLSVACTGVRTNQNERFVSLSKDYVLQPDRNGMQRSMTVQIKFPCDALRERTQKEETIDDDEDWVYNIV